MSNEFYTLDTKVAIPDLTGLTCQIVSVPNYNNLTLTTQIKPTPYDSTKGIGGIIIAKVKNTADFTNGGFITEGC